MPSTNPGEGQDPTVKGNVYHCHLMAPSDFGVLHVPPLPQAKLKSFSTKIVQLLKEWTEAFPYDFQDEKAMAELKAIAHRVTRCDEVRSSLGPWPGGSGVFGEARARRWQFLQEDPCIMSLSL